MQPGDNGVGDRPSLVVRPRLLERMLERFDRTLTLVTAGPGFGKTVLLNQAMRENLLETRGLDTLISASDLNGGRSSLLDALSRFLDRPIHSPASLRESILTLAPTEVCLVVDDIHAMTDADVVQAIIDHLPNNGHLVLAGRRQLPLRLARLRAMGQVAELTEDDLRFTPDEVEQVVAPAGLRSADLHERIGGWPALASLIAAVGSEVVTDFVWEEVLGRFEPDELAALAAWSALGRVPVELLSDIAPADWLDLISRTPLVETNEDGTRLHDLWTIELKAHLTDDERRAVLARAAHQVATTRPDRSIRWWIQAEGWEDLLAFLQDISLGIAIRPSAAVLELAMQAIPESHQERPEFLLADGQRLGIDDPVAASHRFTLAAELFRRQGDERGEAAALFRLIDLAQLARRLDAQRELGAQLEALAAGGEAWIESTWQFAKALELRNAQEPVRALRVLEDLDRSADANIFGSSTAWLRSTLLLQLGEPAAAEEPIRQASSDLTAPSSGLAMANYGWINWLQGQREVTVGLTTPAVKLLEAIGTATWMVTGFCYLSYANAMVGNVDVARELLERAQALSPGQVGQETNLATAEATLAICTGDEARAMAILDGCPDDLVELGDTPVRALALWYVAKPAIRPALADPPGCYVDGYTLAEALLAIRRGHSLPLSDLAIPPAQIVGAYLPPPWVAELALALCEIGRMDEAVTLVEELGSSVRTALHDLHTRSSGSADRLFTRLEPLPSAAWRLQLFGLSELRPADSDYRELDGWRRKRVRELLAYLVEHGRTDRGTVMTALWPDFDERRARRNLEVTLSYLVQLLDGSRPPGEAPYFVRQAGNALYIQTGDAMTTDIEDFDTARTTGLDLERAGAPSEAIEHFRRAAEIGSQTYLGDLIDSEWTTECRNRRRLQYVTAAIRAVELLTADEQAESAVPLAEQAVEIEPWDERIHLALMGARLAAGDRTGAREAGSQLRTVLSELGVDPDVPVRQMLGRVGLGPI